MATTKPVADPDTMCGSCGFPAKTKTGLGIHVLRKHTAAGKTWGNTGKRQPKKPATVVIPDNLICSVCKYDAKTSHGYRMHYIRKHTAKGKHWNTAIGAKIAAQVKAGKSIEEARKIVYEGLGLPMDAAARREALKGRRMGAHLGNPTIAASFGLQKAKRPYHRRKLVEAVAPLPVVNYCPSCGTHLAAVSVAGHVKFCWGCGANVESVAVALSMFSKKG